MSLIWATIGGPKPKGAKDLPLSAAPVEDLWAIQQALAEQGLPDLAVAQRVALQFLDEILRLRAVVGEYEEHAKKLRRQLRKKREARRG